MPELPSGRIAGITSVRARYHAARLNRPVSSEAATTCLYPLIDIILGNTASGGLDGMQNYTFSGYTLADLPRLTHWPDSDRRYFSEWLQQDVAIQEINNARIRIANDPCRLKTLEYDYPVRLYSALRRRLAALPMNRASSEQWRRTLLNMKRDGICDEEIRWSGVLDALSPARGASAGMMTREQVLAQVDFSKIRLELVNELVADGNNSLSFRQANPYEYLSLYGGEDYREWLLLLPDYPRSHFSAHSYARNVLVHARTKTRRDINGRKLLFIEELQSDWHQSARRSTPVAPFRRAWAGLMLKLFLIHATDHHYAGIAWTDGAIQQLRYRKALGSVRRLYDVTIPQCLDRLGKRWACASGSTAIQTKETKLRAKRERDTWRIIGNNALFSPPGSYTMHEAIEWIARHSRNITLPVPVFMISDGMQEHITVHGLPMFGSRMLLK